MPIPTRVLHLEPRHDLEGRTIYFLIPSGDRRKPPQFIDIEDVPDPWNGAGWFECERIRKGPWLKWRALRRVDPGR